MNKKQIQEALNDKIVKELTQRNLILVNQVKELTALLKKDINKSYPSYLKTKHWKRIRNKVLKRDKFKCKECNNRKSLQIHHLTYEHLFNEENHLEDLITLCSKCHKNKHHEP